jgi:hypothetical protein
MGFSYTGNPVADTGDVYNPNPQVFMRLHSEFSRWRPVVVKVRDEEVQVIWDGQALPMIKHAGRLHAARKMLFGRPQIKEITADFSPYGSLGLYLDKESAASFRNVVLRRLEY